MTRSGSVPMARQRRAVLVALLALTAVSWAVVLWQAGTIRPAGDGMAGAMVNGADRLTTGLTAPIFLAIWVVMMAAMKIGAFLAIWVVMMAAMMLPSAAPMILMFDAIQAGKSRQG